jgi:hypothetical protein
MHFSSLLHVCYMPQPSHFPRHDNPNNINCHLKRFFIVLLITRDLHGFLEKLFLFILSTAHIRKKRNENMCVCLCVYIWHVCFVYLNICSCKHFVVFPLFRLHYII